MNDVKIEIAKNGTRFIINGYEFKDVAEYKILSESTYCGVESEINIKLPVKNLEIISV